MEIPTLQWHCKGFPPRANGRTLQARQLEDIIALWQPGRRYPLPNWVIAMLEDCEPLPTDWREQAGDTMLPVIPHHEEHR